MSQNINVDLRPAINAIENVGVILQREINSLQGDVGEVRRDLKLSVDELVKLRSDFDAYVQTSERRANVLQSETKVGALKGELDRQFGHYATVRRTSVGMLQAFDVGNVSNSTVTQVSEELMIQSPRYWLAPALVALAGWSRDDTETVDTSVREAFARDKNKTSLFFALVLRRQGRLDSSVRWLRHYLLSLDPTALTREFAVVLEASAQGAFGLSGENVVAEQLGDWNATLRSRKDIVDAQVSKWTAEVAVHAQVINASHYAELSALSPDWPQVKGQLEAVSALPLVTDKYKEIKDFEALRSNTVEDLLDDILEQLVTEFDEEELPLRRQVAYHDAVIEENGDLDRARAQSAIVLEALEATIDAVSLQTATAITPENLGVSQRTQRVAIGTGRDDFLSGVGIYTKDYRSRYVDQVTIELGPQHSNFASTIGFPGWSARTDDPEATALEGLRATWEQAISGRIAEASFKTSFYIKPGLIALAAVVVCFFINPVLGIIALLAGAAAIYFLGESAKKKAAAQVDQLRQTGEAAMGHSQALFRDAAAQFIDSKLVYKELDDQENRLLQLVQTWPAGTDMRGTQE